MNLQTLALNKIETSNVKNLFFSELKKHCKSSDGIEKFYFENMIMYASTLYEIDVDLESDVIEITLFLIEIKTFLKKRINSQPCKVCELVIQLIECGLAKTSKVRKLHQLDF